VICDPGIFYIRTPLLLPNQQQIGSKGYLTRFLLLQFHFRMSFFCYGFVQQLTGLDRHRRWKRGYALQAV